jgi:uncharacterized protein (DUF488 family)
MMFERQRLLLSLLDTLGEPVGHTDFQKLLFLYTRECEKTPSYEFIPYKFGSFSFTCYADKRRLVEAGLLEDDEQHWRLTETGRQTAQQKSVAPLVITEFCRRYAGLRGYDLIAEVYRRFPYYATRSEIVEKVLADAESRMFVAKARPPKPGPGLLTIGYEGKCLEDYLNQLLHAGITLLCDVRRNPLSRKYGFSKSTLSKACEGVGIRYEHLPELGIASDQRRHLETQADYDVLFEVYEEENLPKQINALERIRRWVMEDKQRVALTCFEKLPNQCHRHCVAEALERSAGGRLTSIHL